MRQGFQKFVDDFIPAIQDKVINITEFGSHRGEDHPELSDIDLFIIAKNRKYTNSIFTVARGLEKSYLGISHTSTTDFLQRHTFLSNDYTGLHLLVIGKEEMDKHFNPKSTRLKLLTGLLVSRTGLLFNIKHKHRLLYGPDLSKLIRLPKLTFRDRLVPFIFPVLLLLILPFLNKRGQEFKIWCFKVLKYHSEDILTYSQIYLKNEKLKLHELDLHYLMLDLASKYRYEPESYPGSGIGLYFQTWASIISNFNYIYSGPRLKVNLPS